MRKLALLVAVAGMVFAGTAAEADTAALQAAALAEGTCVNQWRFEGADVSTAGVDYGLAPEHKFPSQIEECKAAVIWLASHASRLAIDPECIAIGGDSAGALLDPADRGDKSRCCAPQNVRTVDTGIHTGGALAGAGVGKWFRAGNRVSP